MEHERYVLSLLQLPGVGRKSAWKVVSPITRIPASSQELFEELSARSGLRPGTTATEVAKAWAQAERLLEKAAALKIQALAATRPEFPAWLRTIPDPPLVLFLKGNAKCIKTPLSLAVIGTREPTEYGEKVAHRFGKRGAEAGCVIVSGLARGCDSAGHRGCLEAGGKTVAVLAHGLDRIYPKESTGLASEILEKDGCLVSEHPPGARAQRGYFVERDRLQSGMSGGVIVVETDTDGGTMHTARFAQAQCRPVACLAHPPELATSEKARGNQLLLREERATPLSTAEDLCTFIATVREQADRWTASGFNGHQEAVAAPVPEKDLFSGEKGDGGGPL